MKFEAPVQEPYVPVQELYVPVQELYVPVQESYVPVQTSLRQPCHGWQLQSILYRHFDLSGYAVANPIRINLR